MMYKRPNALGFNYVVDDGVGWMGQHYDGPSYALGEHTSYPLGQLPPPAPLSTGFNLANINLRQVLMVVVVVVVAILIGWLMLRMTRGAAKSEQKVERNKVVSRLSTKELAQRLYDRLESKGSRTNAATMRSLERLSR